jgi:glycogen operon protein
MNSTLSAARTRAEPIQQRYGAASLGLGHSAPLGATLVAGGANFSVFSRSASVVELVLFDRVEDARPSRSVKLQAPAHRTYHYWHVFVPGIEPGQIYAYRVHGPSESASGLRFDPKKVLLDPYGRAVAMPPNYDRQAAAAAGDNAATAMKSVVVEIDAYDWEGDTPLDRPSSKSIIYEMHVRGFTRHPTSGVRDDLRGTYAGLIGKIPYLQQLGVTAVELLPVFQFDPQDAPRGKTNYWGYAPISFFAPHLAYCSRPEPLAAVDEFRDLVKALHRAGLEIILDVVFNHTAEGNETGPTLSFRGFEDSAYYILESDGSRYANYSGTGNTLNANHPIVRRLIMDSLRYWVQNMHVDGFRFDLASILARGPKGELLANPPVLWDIESDPLLAGAKIIAEAWDAAGLYQVGSFIGDSWKEWNGRFRDDVRSFFRSDDGTVGKLADRLLGSPEIYGHKQREAEQSVNFVTCHDGFTLNDLVSFNEKHNAANGEENRDGTNDNRSWNCGVEGPSNDPTVERLREQQSKNLLTVTLLSFGLPMLLMGDEVRRTQQGNNNAYCQDNETSWFDWSLLQKHAGLLRFVQLLNARRLMRDAGPEEQPLCLHELLKEAKVSWHGVKLNQPDWSAHSHSLVLNAEIPKDGLVLHLILNAYSEALEFELPPAGKNGQEQWHRWLDTALESPDDIVDWREAASVTGSAYRAGAHSVAALFCFQKPDTPRAKDTDSNTMKRRDLSVTAPTLYQHEKTL